MQYLIVCSKQLNYLSTYDKWAIMKLVSPNICFMQKNSNQFGIAFDMDEEIHLICRK
jgi:hypothetical protein